MTQLEMMFESKAPSEDRPRLSRQCVKILERLRQSPATNVELVHIAMNLTGRISEIRQAGFSIVGKRLHDGVWEYRLIEE